MNNTTAKARTRHKRPVSQPTAKYGPAAINAAAEFLCTHFQIDAQCPAIGVVLGSGLGHVGDVLVENGAKPIDFGDIPGFPVSSVSGHKGRLIFQPASSANGNRNVIVLQGRVHYYEGHEVDAIEFPIRVLKQAGLEELILTNAAGGVNETFTPGDLMLLTDHLCMIPYQPAPASADASSPSTSSPRQGVRNTYCSELQTRAKSVAASLGLKLRHGVYAAMAGPAYETPAEVRMLRILGADAVGMSTALEANAACELGIRVLGISCITNSASGITGDPLCHSEVKETAGRVEEAFASLVLALLT